MFYIIVGNIKDAKELQPLVFLKFDGVRKTGKMSEKEQFILGLDYNTKKLLRQNTSTLGKIKGIDENYISLHWEKKTREYAITADININRKLGTYNGKQQVTTIKSGEKMTIVLSGTCIKVDMSKNKF